MFKLNKKELLENESIRKIQIENEYYFCIEDISNILNEDLSDVEGIYLIDQHVKFATFENLQNSKLSDFNKALLKFRKFKND